MDLDDVPKLDCLFILMNGVPVAEPNPIKQAIWVEANQDQMRIAQDSLEIGDLIVRVSTVFLGVSHERRADGSPIGIFETGIFAEGRWPAFVRADTRPEALRTHIRVVHKLKGKLGVQFLNSLRRESEED